MEDKNVFVQDLRLDISIILISIISKIGLKILFILQFLHFNLLLSTNYFTCFSIF